VEANQTSNESSYFISPWSPRGVLLSWTRRKPKTWSIVWRLFQTTTVPLVLAVIEMVDVMLRSYFLIPARKPKLANSDEVHEAISGLKVGRVLKHLPSERYPSSSGFSMWFSALISSQQSGSTSE
jgi:hypothetical protein